MQMGSSRDVIDHLLAVNGQTREPVARATFEQDEAPAAGIHEETNGPAARARVAPSRTGV